MFTEIPEEQCVKCIWRNDETGQCEGTLSNHGFLQMSPFYKAHHEIRPQLGPGLGDDDCVGLTYRPAEWLKIQKRKTG